MKENECVLAAAILLATTLAAYSQPKITKQPADQSVSLGANVTNKVSATSTNPPISFQWRFATTNLPMATNSSLILTNVQTTNAGDYDAVLADGAGSVTSQVAHLQVDLTFTKITTGSIVTNVGLGWGCAWGDYDNDGFVDLIVTSPYDIRGRASKNFLFHNNRNGTFTQITNSAVVSEARDWRGCAWADYDNDGNLDLYVTSTDAYGFDAQNELFRNNGDGTFTKMTAASVGAIASLAAGGSEHCVWADYDNDGFLEMFVARFGPDWLFHNNGDGTFAKMTNTAVGLVNDDRDSYGAMWGDFDNDGRPDLVVAVKAENGLNQTNFVYHNQGYAFTRILTGSIGTDNEYSVACAWGDYDNDGYLDLFVVNGKYHVATNSLYHNNGDGTFTKMTSNVVGSVASDVAPFSSCAWADYDNDGFIDLYVTSGSISGSPATVPNPNFLYHNNGDGSFTRVHSGSPVTDVGASWGCVWGDYDNDGFLDLFVTHPIFSFDNTFETPNLLYRNNGNSNAWLTVRLTGTASNRSAIGAKVRVQAILRGQALWQMREINTGYGAGGSSLDAHFGLGDATNVDQVRIEWPSGIVQTLTNVAAKQVLTVEEHQNTGALTKPRFTGVSSSTNGAVNLSVTGDASLLYVFEASTNLVNWTKVAVRRNITGIVGFTDTGAAKYFKRFYRVSVP